MIRISIDFDPTIRGTRIWVVDERQDGLYAYKPTEFLIEKIDEAVEVAPTFIFNRRDGHDFLQEFSQALVRAGFKPDELKAMDKEVNAIKYHLEDMRGLVFKGNKARGSSA